MRVHGNSRPAAAVLGGSLPHLYGKKKKKKKVKEKSR